MDTRKTKRFLRNFLFFSGNNSLLNNSDFERYPQLCTLKIVMEGKEYFKKDKERKKKTLFFNLFSYISHVMWILGNSDLFFFANFQIFRDTRVRLTDKRNSAL